MTTQRIITQRELDEFSAGVRQREVFAAQRRDRRRPTPEDIRARLANPPQLAPVTGKPIPPSVKAEATEAFIAMLAADAYDTPTILATEQGVRDVENTWRTTEAAVESHYVKWPEHRWYDLLQPADDLLRKPADDAAAAFTTTTAPGIPAIVATCKVTEPWVMHSADDLANAFAAIAGEIHCDFQIGGPTVIDAKRFESCVAWFEHATTRKPKGVEHPDDPSVQMRRDDHAQWARQFIASSFVTLPVARGDLVILVRVCSWCLGAYLTQNAVDSAKCVVNEPYSDGFGSVPWKVIETPATDESHDEPPDRFIYESDMKDDYEEDDDG